MCKEEAIVTSRVGLLHPTCKPQLLRFWHEALALGRVNLAVTVHPSTSSPLTLAGLGAVLLLPG